VVVTDGIFSMRGDHAPLVEIQATVRKFDERFPENAVLVVDDSHGVGAFGRTGRGTEEFTGCEPTDILVGTLGKAFGVNGGYVTGARVLVDFLRETSMMYIYSNRITRPLAAKDFADAVDARYMDRTFAKLGWAVPKQPPFLPAGWKGDPGKPPFPEYMHAINSKTPQAFPEKGDLVKAWSFGGKSFAP
jgi:hypothetical protein